MAHGPCLGEIKAWNKVALIGDASHPLSGKQIHLFTRIVLNLTGPQQFPWDWERDKNIYIADLIWLHAGAFGSGAAFAMEDAWILARAIDYSSASSASKPVNVIVKDALNILDEIRSPYYRRMYVNDLMHVFCICIVLFKRRSSRHLKMYIYIYIYIYIRGPDLTPRLPGTTISTKRMRSSNKLASEAEISMKSSARKSLPSGVPVARWTSSMRTISPRSGVTMSRLKTKKLRLSYKH